MHVLVTGGAGCVGSHLIDFLRAAGHRVTNIDSLHHGVWNNQPPPYLRTHDVTFLHQDLRSWQPNGTVADIEAVIHCAALGGVARAAREPQEVWSANVDGTVQLIEAMSHMPRLRRVILISSFSVYGNGYRYRVLSTGRILTAERRWNDLAAGRFEIFDPETGEAAEVEPITEAAPTNPLDPYAASKLGQEACFTGFLRAPLTILRLSSVVARRMRHDDTEATIIAKLIGQHQRGEAPQIYEDGRQTRDWVSVHDITELIARLVDGLDAPPVVNVCSGEAISLLDACSILREVLGAKVEPTVVGGYRPGDMRHCVGDPSGFTALLGRTPTPFRTGIERMFTAQVPT